MLSCSCTAMPSDSITRSTLPSSAPLFSLLHSVLQPPLSASSHSLEWPLFTGFSGKTSTRHRERLKKVQKKGSLTKKQDKVRKKKKKAFLTSCKRCKKLIMSHRQLQLPQSSKGTQDEIEKC